jgi:glutathione S-transferase
MAIKFHRCGNTWMKIDVHPCWKVQKALDEQGIQYEIVTEPWPFNRAATEARTGQKKYPWFEFEDGSVYRAESKEMAETIRAGRLDSKPGAAAAV